MPDPRENPGLVLETGRPFTLPGGAVIKPGNYLEELMAMRFTPRAPSYQLNLAQLRAQNAASALKQVAATRQLMDALPQAPWLVRKKLGKSGGLYTLGEVQRMVASNKATEVARSVKAQAKTAAKAASLEATVRRSGVTLRGAAYGSTSDAANYYAMVLGETIYQHGRAVDRRRSILAVGRRGAAATRPLQPTRAAGLTNRTGAESTRSLVVTASTSTISAPPTSGAARKLSTGGSAVGESQRSKDARAIMAATKALPQVKQTTATPSRTTTTGNLLSLVTRMGRTLFARPPTRARVGAGVPPRIVAPRTPLTTVPGLTPLEAVGVRSSVGSQVAQAKCDCPKPKAKEKKSREPSCRNPVISRTVKDGIRTTKVKLQCP